MQGLTDKIPQAIDVSVPYSYKINNVPENIKLYYVKKEIAELVYLSTENGTTGGADNILDQIYNRRSYVFTKRQEEGCRFIN